MLKHRILTAVILIPLLVWAIFALPKAGLAILVGVVFLAAAWEWTRLAELNAAWQRALYCLLMAALMYVVWRMIAGHMALIHLALYATALLWLFALIWLYLYETKSFHKPVSQFLRVLIGYVLLVMPFAAIMVLTYYHHNAPAMMLYLMVIIWSADSGAYFSGRKWGKHKLAPTISPGKSWEGVAGGFIVAFMVTLIAGWQFGYQGNDYLYFVLISLATIVFSVVGDLFESVFKRQTGIKDSGNLLPGHGGMLDRIDSLNSAAPIFVAGLLITGVIG